MGFQSILFGDTEPNLVYDVPDYFKDLQLDYLVEKILEQGDTYKSEPYFYTFPGKPEVITYRQQVCQDMESKELRVVLKGFCRRLANARKVYDLSQESEGDIASATYHLRYLCYPHSGTGRRGRKHNQSGGTVGTGRRKHTKLSHVTDEGAGVWLFGCFGKEVPSGI